MTIADAKRKIKHGEKIENGRLKRVQKQLRIEEGILTKSGRLVVPASMRKFVNQTYHSIDLFTDSDAIFEMSIWQCIMVYSGYMKSKQTRYRTT